MEVGTRRKKEKGGEEAGKDSERGINDSKWEWGE